MPDYCTPSSSHCSPLNVPLTSPVCFPSPSSLDSVETLHYHLIQPCLCEWLLESDMLAAGLDCQNKLGTGCLYKDKSAGTITEQSHRAAPLAPHPVDAKLRESSSCEQTRLSLVLEQEEGHVLWKQECADEKEKPKVCSGSPKEVSSLCKDKFQCNLCIFLQKHPTPASLSLSFKDISIF